MSLHLAYISLLRRDLCCTPANVLTDFSEDRGLIDQLGYLLFDYCHLAFSGWLDLIWHITDSPDADCFHKLNPNVVKPMGCHAWRFRKKFCPEPSFTLAWRTIYRLSYAHVYFPIPCLCVYTLDSKKLGHTKAVTKFWPRNSVDVPEDQGKPK